VPWYRGLVSILCGRSVTRSFLPTAVPSSANPIAFLRGVTAVPNTDYSYWVSHNVFAMYQLMFAIITPALIVGSWRSE